MSSTSFFQTAFFVASQFFGDFAFLFKNSYQILYFNKKKVFILLASPNDEGQS